MQLNRGLQLATLALLGNGPALAADGPPGWSFESATLIYSETGGRVQAVEPKFRATRRYESGRSFSAGLTVDALTGASPNGAAPSSQPQTFTRPSGNGSYTVAPGERPLDDSFRDTRIAVEGSFTEPLGTQTRLTASLFGSNEYDYRALGLGATLARDFNQRNTTLSLGFNLGLDTVDAVGGAPLPLAAMAAPGETPPRLSGPQDKQVLDLLLGLTQVLGPRSLLSLSLSYSDASGYLTDPYKLVSVLDGNGAPLRYLYESRPGQRSKWALYGEYRHFVFDRDRLAVSLRWMTDDWGVDSQTLDGSYRFNLASGYYLEPHARYYRQSAAEFYRVAVSEDEAQTLRHASGDPRLGAFDAVTLGLQFGHATARYPWWARLEGYTQLGQREGLSGPLASALRDLPVEPELDALMLTVGLRF